MEHPVDAGKALVEGPGSPEAALHHSHLRHIGLLLFDGCSLPGASVVAEAFRLANEITLARNQRPVYQLSLLSYRGGNIACSSSIRVWTQGLDASPLRNFDAIFIACSESEAMAERDVRLLSWLCEISSAVLDRYQSGQGPAMQQGHASATGKPLEPVASSESIAVGRHAPPVFWFKDAPAATPVSAPSPADMALSQIEADLGAAVAQQVAAHLEPHRHNRVEAEPDDVPVAAISDKIRESARWITENYAEPISVTDAARVAAMSERNYLRRFRCELGVTPSEYLLRARLDMICRLLKETDLPVDKIARRCGMGNGDRLARIFRKRFALSPTEYRFNGRAQARRDRPVAAPVLQHH
ncbi:helix-turn-helix domain-containing protein [Paraburkholderia saeva]|uniref:helix-turn-helix domain-containing protein n=1 Tax=Paraburkholderia saeva TaxID=2777537 RepID=UPI001DE43A5F|nr:helix-turn-helix domain-containing protein [Paraburkholderia saeva]CAG4898795.1 HTH-type transcriptional regulator CdhR [Paraburkholderia saeva]